MGLGKIKREKPGKMGKARKITDGLSPHFLLSIGMKNEDGTIFRKET
jgi:hypothetical protein